MANLVRFLGIFGLVVLGFGIVSGFVVGSFTYELVIIHLVIGFICIAVWAAMVGSQTLGDAQQVIKGRTTRFGANAALYTAVCVGLLAAGNWIIQRHNKRWDLTAEKVYSISLQSESIVKDLNKPLKFVGFKGLTDDDNKLQDLLRLYQDKNPSQVSVEIIDPRAKPQLLTKYGMKKGNLLYIEYRSGDQPQVSRINETTEEAVTNAILKLTKGEAKKVYFVYGHEELSTEDTEAGGLSALASMIKDDHLTSENLLLAQTGKVPVDASAVILVSPKSPLMPVEKQALIAYGQSGGRLLLLTDPHTTKDVADIAAAFGIKVGDDIIVDQINKLTGSEIGFQLVAADFDKTSPITKNFTARNGVVFNAASSVTKIGDGIAGAQYTHLLKSSPNGWGEVNLSAVFDSDKPTVKNDPEDMKGPVPVGISYEKKFSEKTSENDKKEGQFDKVSRVVVFGDSDWIVNANITFFSARDLILNSLNWLAGEEGGITIRPGEMKGSENPIPSGTFLLIFLTSLLAPEAILIFGLWIWWKRRTLTTAMA